MSDDKEVLANNEEDLERAIFGYAQMFVDVFKFQVFPLKRRSKTPATSNGFHDSTGDMEAAAEIWRDTHRGCNIGVRTGWASGGLVVIDIDLAKKEGDVPGADSLQQLEKLWGMLPQTLAARTPSGGMHYYFYVSGEHPFPTICEDFGKVALGNRDLRTCIDIRGEGGYVVAPPSVLENGAYEFVSQAEGASPIAHLPQVWQDGLRAEMTCVSVPTKDELQAVGGVPMQNNALLKEVKDSAQRGEIRGMVLTRMFTHWGKEAFEAQFGPTELDAKGGPRSNDGFSQEFDKYKPAPKVIDLQSASKATPSKRKRKKKDGPGIERMHVDNWLDWMVPPSSRAEWLKVGMALHDWDNGGAEGMEIWNTWSEAWWNGEGERDARKLEAQYKAFQVDKIDEVTAITLYHLAQEGVVARLNQTLAVRLDATTAEFYQRVANEIIACKPDKLELEFKNQPFYTLNDEGEPKRSNPFLYWTSAKERNSVVGLTAHIDHARTFIRGADGNNRINIWRGLPQPGCAGRAEAFKKFMFEVICAGRDDVYTWLWKWVAYKAQNPLTVSKSACIIYGEKGTGKNLFYEYLCRAFGEDNCVLFDTKDQLGAKHNTMRLGKILECSDEVLFMQDVREENQMKPLVTQEKIIIEPKHAKQFEAPKFSMWLIFTNDRRPLRVSDDERRYTFIKPNSQHSPSICGVDASHAYYEPVYFELNNGGPTSLLAELLETDLTNFRPFPGLETAETRSLMQETDKGEDEWFSEIMESGIFPIAVTESRIGGNKITTFLKSAAQEYARTFCQKYNIRTKSGMAVGLLCTRLKLDQVGRGKMSISLPALPDLRALWLKAYPKSPGFQHRTGWEMEEWVYQAVNRDGLTAEEKKPFLETEYNVEFPTEKQGRAN